MKTVGVISYTRHGKNNPFKNISGVVTLHPIFRKQCQMLYSITMQGGRSVGRTHNLSYMHPYADTNKQ